MRRCEPSPLATDASRPSRMPNVRQARWIALWLLTAAVLWVSLLSSPIRTVDDHIDSYWVQGFGRTSKHTPQGVSHIAKDREVR